MSAVEKWRRGLFTPGLVALILGLVGIVASYLLLLTANVRLDLAGYESIGGTFALILIGALLVTTLGAAALLIRGRLRAWAAMPPRKRSIHIIGTTLLIVLVGAMCAFDAVVVFTVTEFITSCQRYEC
jgi:hypothetical protein